MVTDLLGKKDMAERVGFKPE